MRLVKRVSNLVLQLVVFEVVPLASTDDTPKSPTFRIVAYDPKSASSHTLMIPPSIVEIIAGGFEYSSYLDSLRREELARLVCSELIAVKQKENKFTLQISAHIQQQAEKSTEEKEGEQQEDEDFSKFASNDNATLHLQRQGKLARFGVRICSLQLILTFFGPTLRDLKQRTSNKSTVLINLYSTTHSIAAEISITEKEQIERCGNTVLSFNIGVARTTALRTLAKSLVVHLIIPTSSSQEKRLRVTLLPIEKAFLPYYEEITSDKEEDKIGCRPIGCPEVFLPLNSCGDLLISHQVHLHICKNHMASMQFMKEEVAHKSKSTMSCLLSLFTKEKKLSPAKGMVLHVLNQHTQRTSILHIGPSQLKVSCIAANDEDLLQDISNTFSLLQTHSYEFLEREEDETRLLRLLRTLVSAFEKDLKLRIDELLQWTPYFSSSSSTLSKE